MGSYFSSTPTPPPPTPSPREEHITNMKNLSTKYANCMKRLKEDMSDQLEPKITLFTGVIFSKINDIRSRLSKYYGNNDYDIICQGFTNTQLLMDIYTTADDISYDDYTESFESLNTLYNNFKFELVSVNNKMHDLEMICNNNNLNNEQFSVAVKQFIKGFKVRSFTKKITKSCQIMQSLLNKDIKYYKGLNKDWGPWFHYWTIGFVSWTTRGGYSCKETAEEYEKYLRNVLQPIIDDADDYNKLFANATKQLSLIKDKFEHISFDIRMNLNDGISLTIPEQDPTQSITFITNIHDHILDNWSGLNNIITEKFLENNNPVTCTYVTECTCKDLPPPPRPHLAVPVPEKCKQCTIRKRFNFKGVRVLFQHTSPFKINCKGTTLRLYLGFTPREYTSNTVDNVHFVYSEKSLPKHIDIKKTEIDNKMRDIDICITNYEDCMKKIQFLQLSGQRNI